jgi:serine/threonine protein phosphatase PrpC/CRP-like cAMP-binding protein
MGCSNSTLNDSNSNNNNSSSKKSIISNDDISISSKAPLTPQQINARIDASPVSLKFIKNDLNWSYAWVSQRGYYPNAPYKENQDAYTCLPKFGDQGDMSFFGIFDGHGKDGHLCARFASKVLPMILSESISKFENVARSVASVSQIRQMLTLSHIQTNQRLRDDRSIEEKLAGTTAISCLFHNNLIYISNVGDSRAILIYRNAEDRLVAKPLSSDQTPYRKDERERVKKYGARILSMDQIEGLEPVHENWGDLTLGNDIDEEGDPPRVWHPEEDFPGTAFTRSIGDTYAEELGVTAEPEIIEISIADQDQMIVIASDGIFEFITNQMVADIAKHHNDPLSLCKALVAEAYELWLQYEVRTDDISCIALYIDEHLQRSRTPIDIKSASTPSLGSASSSRNPSYNNFSSIAEAESRPVRRVLSKEKRKNIIIDQEVNVEDGGASQKLIEKSEDEIKSITSAISSHFLFQHLNAQQKSEVIGVMEPIDVKKGEWVITQGDKGDKFYVINTGTFEVRVKSPTGTDPSGGPVVHVYESDEDHHPGFGELSLMYGKPRAASVIAVTDGKVWGLDRITFKKVIMRAFLTGRRDVIRQLRKVDILKSLSTQQLQRLADLLNEAKFVDGQYIIRQGEPGDNFYLIIKGSCDVTINGVEGEPEKTVFHLQENSYFGERALLTDEPRNANIVAKGTVTVVYIGKTAFEEVLGPLATIIDEARKQREIFALETIAGPKSLVDIRHKGFVMSDALGPILLGQHNSSNANLTIRSFLLNEVNKLNQQQPVIKMIDAVRSITHATSGNVLVPKLLGVMRESNAIHLLISSPIIGDLNSVIRSNNADGSLLSSFSQVLYIGACITHALEHLHKLGCIYRAIQPETLYLNSSGQVIIMDYRFCKMGVNRTFTMCGASEYLSPEQILQKGHGQSVDFWALGVLLYELSTGTHPFAATTEVATYAKISSFGMKTFPHLEFPSDLAPEVVSIINKLVIPNPEARLGASTDGITSLKNQALFLHINWNEFNNNISPLANLAKSESETIMSEGVKNDILQSFSIPFDGDKMEEIEEEL